MNLMAIFMCNNYKFLTIFMLVYESVLRIGEVADLRAKDIESKNISISKKLF